MFIQTAKEVKGHDLQALGEERWTRSQVLKGVRGTIYDRAGNALAEELDSYTAFAILDDSQPSYVKDPVQTAKQLAPYIHMEEEKLVTLLQSDKFQVELGTGAKHMTHEQMEEIKALQLDGIFFNQEPKRYYPNQNYASHIIGYTERNMAKAKMGIERSLDEQLRPEDGLIYYKSDRKGIPLPNPSRHVTPAKNGYDVYLTLDSNIQTALEQIMTKVENEYEPEKVIAVVADPKTGEILAMSNRPSFNPNEYEEITNFMNYAISDHFEPGSTMKMFTVAAAIEEGLYNGGETYQSGRYQIGPDVIFDHNDGYGWGIITFDEGFLRSSNVAMSKLALEKLGSETFFNYWHRFGFTEPTGIDLPNEAGSLIANSHPIDTATTSFGQGTAVTPIQQIQAATAIANGGKMMKPYVIDRIVNSDTNTTINKTEPEIVGEPISKETANHVLDLLEQVVVSPSGTGKPYYIEGFNVAGKTGTAQIRNPQGRGYLKGHGQNVFSFLGMAPKEDPRVVVYVAVDRPKLKSTEAGSEPTSRIFNTIMKHSLQYLNITHSVEEEVKQQIEEGFKTVNYKGNDVEEVIKQAEEAQLSIVLLGDGPTVEAQQPLPHKGMLPGERLFIKTNSEEATMPNMIGWSSRDVKKLVNVMDMNSAFFGNGYVISQSIEPGSTISKGDYIVIELQPRNRKMDADEREDEENAQ